MTTENQFDKVIENCLDIFSKKMKDYGSAWRILRLQSLTDQIYIKAQERGVSITRLSPNSSSIPFEAL